MYFGIVARFAEFRHGELPCVATDLLKGDNVRIAAFQPMKQVWQARIVDRRLTVNGRVRQEVVTATKNRRRRNRRPQLKPQPWARDFLKPTEADLERERLRREVGELRKKLDAANDLVVEARLRMKGGRWR